MRRRLKHARGEERVFCLFANEQKMLSVAASRRRLGSLLIVTVQLLVPAPTPFAALSHEAHVGVLPHRCQSAR